MIGQSENFFPSVALAFFPIISFQEERDGFGFLQEPVSHPQSWDSPEEPVQTPQSPYRVHCCLDKPRPGTPIRRHPEALLLCTVPANARLLGSFSGAMQLRPRSFLLVVLPAELIQLLPPQRSWKSLPKSPTATV